MLRFIKKEDRQGTKMYLRSWLLSIEAFNRLFPPEFYLDATVWDNPYAQDFTRWGQVIDREGELNPKMVNKFWDKVKNENHEDIVSYFPLDAKYSEKDLNLFFDYYGVN